MANKILYLALITSIAGLMLLTYAANILEPDIIEISKIDNNYLYKNVHVNGEIVALNKFKGGNILLIVGDETGTIDVFLEYPLAKKLNLNFQDGEKVDVIGTVNDYNGNLQINVNDYKHIIII